MTKNILLVGTIGWFLASCNQTPQEVVIAKDAKTQAKAEIENKEDLFADSTMTEADYLEIIRSYKVYATTYTEDTAGSEYAWKAALASKKIGKKENYISYCEIVVTNFPETYRAPFAAYVLAKDKFEKDGDKATYFQNLRDIMDRYKSSPIIKDIDKELNN